MDGNHTRGAPCYGRSSSRREYKGSWTWLLGALNKVPLRFPHAVGCGPKLATGTPQTWQTTNHTPADLLTRAFLRKRLLSIQGKKHSACSRNSSSQSATPYMKMVQIAPQPELLEASGNQGANSTVSEKQGISPLDLMLAMAGGC
nr:uncharacterized protein LOC117855843 isoform X2 [Setaria viridis]